MQRFGQVIGVKPEAFEEYERLYAQVWSEVLATIHACNIRSYTIFRHEQMLFAYSDRCRNSVVSSVVPSRLSDKDTFRRLVVYCCKMGSFLDRL